MQHDENPIIYVYCPERKRRAVLVKGKCQYCKSAGHKLYRGGFFDLPGDVPPQETIP